MKIHLPLAIALLIGLSSCDKIKDALTQQVKKNLDASQLVPAEPYDGELVTQVNAENFGEFTSIPGRVVIVDFYADWCGPCRRLSPELDAIAEEHGGRVLIGKVDAEKHQDLAREHAVNGIPDLRVYVGGKEVEKLVAPSPQMVRQTVDELLELLPPLPKKKPEKPPVKDQPEPEKEPVKQPEKQPMTKDWMPPGVERR